LPVSTTLGPLTGTVEFRTLFARTVEFGAIELGAIELRTILAALAWTIKPWPVRTARAVARRTCTTFRPIRAALPLLPRLGFTARRAVAEITARSAISAAIPTIAPAAIRRAA